MKTQQEIDSQRITAAIGFLIRNYTLQPRLDDVADHVHLSPFHFQRLFRKRVGVTPKQFARYLSVEHAKKYWRRPMPRFSMPQTKSVCRRRAACTICSSGSKA